MGLTQVNGKDMTKELSVIIVNYNGEKFLKKCIQSVLLYCKGIDLEIIIVDNNSSDNSLDLILLKDARINIIKNKENLGFSRANNIGIKESKKEYILLLNNDTILLDPLAVLFEYMEKQERVGLVSIQMVDKDKQYRCSTGYFPNLLNIILFRFMYHRFDRNQLKSTNFVKVQWVEGSFLFVKRDILKQVNGLSDKYFMYVEDIDLCKKIADDDYYVYYYPQLRYIHFGGYDESRNNMLIDSMLIYTRKYFSGILEYCIVFILNFKKRFR